MADHAVGESQTHRPAGLPRHNGGDHTETGMVIYPGDHFGFAAVGQLDAADDVHLPQFHRPVPLPPDVITPAPASFAAIDQAVAAQDPIRRRDRRHSAGAAIAAQLEHDPHRPPPRMIPTQRAHRRLHLRCRLMRTRHRPMRTIAQRLQALGPIAREPHVQTLPRHPELERDLTHPAAALHRHNRPEPLFLRRQLPQCQSRLPATRCPQTSSDQGAESGTCQASGESAM